jgi:hypothetical protein
MTEIKTDSYCVTHGTPDAQEQIITFIGALRLNGMDEYAPIVDLFNQVAEAAPMTVKLDVRQLEFLNSSGINILSKFVIKLRQQQNIQMVVQGSQKIAWQGKSLKNLQRLMPTLQLQWD